MVSVAHVSSSSKVARRSGLQHVGPRSLTRLGLICCSRRTDTAEVRFDQKPLKPGGSAHMDIQPSIGEKGNDLAALTTMLTKDASLFHDMFMSALRGQGATQEELRLAFDKMSDEVDKSHGELPVDARASSPPNLRPIGAQKRRLDSVGETGCERGKAVRALVGPGHGASDDVSGGRGDVSDRDARKAELQQELRDCKTLHDDNLLDEESYKRLRDVIVEKLITLLQGR